MESLLYIVHRIPYPPNKGDKIRSYNIFKYLSKKYNIYLCAFVDDDNDWKYIKYFKTRCADSFFIKLNPSTTKLSCLTGLLTGEALSVVYYKNRKFKEWIDTTIEKNSIEKILAFSSPMAQFFDENKMETKTRIMDLVDVDSDKWYQYSKTKKWPAKWLYKREAKKLFEYECKIVSSFDKTTLVSENEANLLRSLVEEDKSKINYFSNGVDTEYFSPDRDYKSPYSTEEKIIVFTGVMDYWANIDAVTWFVESIFPTVRDTMKEVVFYIVGSNPAPEVRALEKISGVEVTGAVVDIRPYVYFSDLVVAPLRIARGIQNKVLEAMSLARPVLATSSAAEGINAVPDKHLFIADSEHEYQKRALEILKNSKYQDLATQAREFVVDNYSWESKLKKIDLFLQKKTLHR